MLGNITSREKFLGFATIGIALLALAYNFAIEPLIGQWNALEGEIREKEILLTKHNRVANNKEAIEKSYSEYTRFFVKEKKTPDEESAEALGNIEKLARGTNTRITNIKPLTVKNFEHHTKFTFRVTTESSMGELTKFIYDLQSSEQLLKIEKMVLRAKERSSDIVKAVLNVTKISVF